MGGGRWAVGVGWRTVDGGREVSPQSKVELSEIGSLPNHRHKSSSREKQEQWSRYSVVSDNDVRKEKICPHDYLPHESCVPLLCHW